MSKALRTATAVAAVAVLAAGLAACGGDSLEKSGEGEVRRQAAARAP